MKYPILNYPNHLFSQSMVYKIEGYLTTKKAGEVIEVPVVYIGQSKNGDGRLLCHKNNLIKNTFNSTIRLQEIFNKDPNLVTVEIIYNYKDINDLILKDKQNKLATFKEKLNFLETLAISENICHNSSTNAPKRKNNGGGCLTNIKNFDRFIDNYYLQKDYNPIFDYDVKSFPSVQLNCYAPTLQELDIINRLKGYVEVSLFLPHKKVLKKLKWGALCNPVIAGNKMYIKDGCLSDDLSYFKKTGCLGQAPRLTNINMAQRIGNGTSITSVRNKAGSTDVRLTIIFHELGKTLKGKRCPNNIFKNNTDYRISNINLDVLKNKFV